MKNKKEVQELVENIRLLCDARNSISNPTKALIHNTIKLLLTELKKLIDKQPDCDSTFKELREALRHSTTRENDKRKIIDGLQDKLYAADRTRINLHKVIDEYSVRIATLLTQLNASYKVEKNFAKKIKNLRAQLIDDSHQNYCKICGNLLDGYVPPKPAEPKKLSPEEKQCLYDDINKIARLYAEINKIALRVVFEMPE